MLTPRTQATIEKLEKEALDTSTGVSVHAETQSPVTIQDVLAAVSDLGEDRDYLVKTMLAVYASTFIPEKNPLWLMIVGNPSSNKTTLVDLLKDLPDVHRVDTLTSNPFSSGQREVEKPQDLLPLINGKCFVVKEYATILGRSDEMVKQLLSDLVAIYDGEYAKHSPTRGSVVHRSTFSHIGCVTPMALKGRQRYMEAVGARFLHLRIPSLSQEKREAAIEKIWEGIDETEVADRAREVVRGFRETLKERVKEYKKIRFSPEARAELSQLAQLVARARGTVIAEATSFKNDEEENVTHYEVVDKQIEEPFRALKQLKKLAIALALVNGHLEVGKNELEVVRMVALSSMHVARAEILVAFEKVEIGTAPTISELLDKPYKSVKRHLDELVALGILESKKSENDKARPYNLKPEFKRIFRSDDAAVLPTPETIFSDWEVETTAKQE